MRELQEQLEQAQAKVEVEQEAEQEAERVRLLERQRAVEEAQRREEQKRAEAEAAKRAEAERRKQGVIRRPKACNQCVRANVTCEWPTGAIGSCLKHQTIASAAKSGAPFHCSLLARYYIQMWLHFLPQTYRADQK